MTKPLDDRRYWLKRHEDFDSIRSSGFKSLSDTGNSYIYKILSEQYLKLLLTLDLPSKAAVIDCGFGDGYFINFFTDNFKLWDVHGFDLSDRALSKAKKNNKRANLFVADFSQPIRGVGSFDIVHSFDVLYHILDDKGYINALTNMCELSEKYVVVHEKFLTRTPLLNATHVKFRTVNFTDQILNSNGFYLYSEMPTHFMAIRLLTYRLNKLFPESLYKIDKRISTTHPSTQMRLASHRIRVYKKSFHPVVVAEP